MYESISSFDIILFLAKNKAILLDKRLIIKIIPSPKVQQIKQEKTIKKSEYIIFKSEFAFEDYPLK